MNDAEGSGQDRDRADSDLEGQLSALRDELQAERKQKEQLAALAADYLDSARRVQAEFENYKRRSVREREEIIKCANHKLLSDLLLVVDDFERAVAAKCSEEELRSGITRIHDNLASLLKDYGLREIPSDGRFDPSVHEAFAVGEGEDGKILETYQKGYYLGDKVLRCSKVKVAKNTGGNND
jgi:molecular chaperone GrpE